MLFMCPTLKLEEIDTKRFITICNLTFNVKFQIQTKNCTLCVQCAKGIMDLFSTPVYALQYMPSVYLQSIEGRNETEAGHS